MATVISASLRDEFDGYKADIDAVRKEGQISKEADVIFSGLYSLLGIVITIFLETPTPRSIVKCNTCKSWKELFKILA